MKTKKKRKERRFHWLVGFYRMLIFDLLAKGEGCLVLEMTLDLKQDNSQLAQAVLRR